ncbi:MAG: LptF/LptG family permease, partial [Gemmatimonadales bacterium]
MRLISRHILRSLAAPFFWGVAALTGLLLLNSLPPLIERFGGKGLPASIMIEGVLLFLPALLALTLPMAVLVSTLYGYSQLAAALEMVAMYANGISVWRMARPALIGAAVIAGVNFFVFDQLVPRSNIRFSDLQTAVMNKSPTLALQQQVLNVLPPPSGYVLRAASIDQVTGAMRGVTIFDLSATAARRLIVADSGSMAESASGRDLILTLHSGEIYEFTGNEPGQLQQTTFVHDRVLVRNVQNELQLDNSRTNRGEREKTSCELLDGIASQQWSVASLTRESESYTRRDLRAMTGLPPVLAPSVQNQPALPPHCGAYRRFEQWFRRLMLPQQLGAQVPQQPVAQQPATPPAAAPAPQNPPLVQPGARQFLVPPPRAEGSDLITPFAVVDYTD